MDERRQRPVGEPGNGTAGRASDGWRSRLGGRLRQRRQHPEFRIATPLWDAAQRAELARLIAALPRDAEGKPSERPTDTGEPTERPPDTGEQPAAAAEKATLSPKPLADAATNLWSALRSLERAAGRPTREARNAGRYLRNTRDALTDAGVRIHDYDGQAFHPGLSLDVLAYQEDPALREEIITETVRPAVYLHTERIQVAKVIVGHPPDTAPDHEGNSDG